MAKNLRAGDLLPQGKRFMLGDSGPYRVFVGSAPETGGTVETVGTLEPGTPLIGLIDPSTNTDLYQMEITGYLPSSWSIRPETWIRRENCWPATARS